MNLFDSTRIILTILYCTAAIFLLIVSYMLYIKRFKRNKLLAVNQVVFTTSRYDTYEVKTQFLIELSEKMFVTLKVLDANEQEVRILLSKDLEQGQNVVDFYPTEFEDGIYFLSLETTGTLITRRIKIKCH
jgi:hypothetical protein